MNYQGTKHTNRSSNTSKSENMEREKSSTSGSFTSFAKDTARETGEAFSDIGKGIFEQLINSDTVAEVYPEARAEAEKLKKPTMNLESGTLFSRRDVEESRQIEEIKELIQAIKQEVESIKKADKTLMDQVSDIEKLTLDSMPEKMGIYHVRFLEIVLKVLQTMRLKVGESGTWMQALMSKKKKRGSAFATRTKSKGTQYSMSEELKITRNVQ